MKRRAMRRMVRIEGVIIALFGGVLGLFVGSAFGAALVTVLPQRTAVLSFPITRMSLLFVVSGILGVVSAITPARRAGRLDVLEAIAEE